MRAAISKSDTWGSFSIRTNICPTIDIKIKVHGVA